MATLASPLKLLIVDDNPGVLEALWIFLQDQGYDIALAQNGLEALRLIQGGLIPHLIITDILMPEMDGFELCRAIRKDQSLSRIPFLFLTAFSQACDRLNGYWAGADDYMTKPFNFEDLNLKIKTLLDIYFMKKPQAVFCHALKGVATWMVQDNVPAPVCLTKGQCPSAERKKLCALNQSYCL